MRRSTTSSVPPSVPGSRLFARLTGSSSVPAQPNNYGSNGFLVDMTNVAYAPLRDTTFKASRQANDADEVSNEFLSECTLIVQRPETHSLVKN